MKISVSNPKTPLKIASVWAGEYKKKWRVKSGSIVTFSDAWVGSKIYPNASIVPVQSLNGQDKPYPPGGGKNKYSGGDISLGGSNPRTANITIDKIPAGSYYLSATWSGTSLSGYGLQFFDANNTNVGNMGGNGALTLTGDAVRIYAYMRSADYSDGKTVIVSNIQIESGSTPTSYAPYSNICPITGYSSVDVSRCGKNVSSINERSDNPRAFWGTDWSAFLPVLNRLPVGTYTVSEKFEVVTLPDNNIVWHTRPYLTAMANGEQVAVTPNPVQSPTVDESPAVGKIYEESVSFEITEAIKGNFNHFYSYCDKSTHSGTRGSYNLYDLQIEVGSEATPYAPYNGITKTISLGNTYYGGILNVDSGVLTVDRVYWKKNTSTMNNSENYPGWTSAGIRDYFSESGNQNNAMTSVGNVYAVNVAGNNDTLYLPKNSYGGLTQTNWIALGVDVEIIIPLPTPTTIQLTGEEITALLGENNVWASSGDVEVTYRKGGM